MAVNGLGAILASDPKKISAKKEDAVRKENETRIQAELTRKDKYVHGAGDLMLVQKRQRQEVARLCSSDESSKFADPKNLVRSANDSWH